MSEFQNSTLTSLPLLPYISDPTNPPDWYFVHQIHNLLTASECAAIIAKHQNLVPSNVTPETKRDREIFDDEELAELLWSRMQPFYPTNSQAGPGRVKDEHGQFWKISGLNAKLRLCRYDPEGRFTGHQDGRRLESVNECAFMTVNVYLNTVPLGHGGATRALSGFKGEVLGSVQPEQGMGAIFRDCLWHDGETLSEGVKYLLRTDIMYEREEPFNFESRYETLGDVDQGWKALAIAEALEDAGNHDEAIWWYKKAFRLDPRLERGLQNNNLNSSGKT